MAKKSVVVNAITSIDIIATEDVITVVANDFSERHQAVGVSRRHPDDQQDQDLGLMLAQGRALRQLGRNILREANEQVRKNADAARRQEEASQAAKKARNARRAKASREANLQREREARGALTKQAIEHVTRPRARNTAASI
jgi:hypothetical protein